MTLDDIEKSLHEAGIDEAKTESYLLAEYYLHIPKSRLVLMRGEEICGDGNSISALENAIKRRKKREPLTYILGIAYFMDEEYEVSPQCLVPRPETELLVLEADNCCQKNGQVLDVCTGSGCIAISLSARRSDISCDAVDVSSGAISLAVRNAKRNGVGDRVSFHEADMFSYEPRNKYDLIVSNPPYIAKSEMDSLMPELSFEPQIALTDGGDGLSFYRELIGRYTKYIKENGYLLCEIGYTQSEDVLKIAKDCGFDGEIISDYSGNPRVLKIKITGGKTF